MKIRRLPLATIAALIGVVTLVSCATTRGIPKAVDATRGGIGTLMSFRDAAVPFASDRPHTVFFVKAGEDGDLISQPTVIASNYSNGSFLYALNLEPGRYTAVAGQYTNVLELDDETVITERIVFFEKTLVQNVVVDVEPGRIVFMGDLDIQNHTTYYEDSDAAQDHYMKLLNKEEQLLGSLVENNNDERRTRWFLKFALRQFKNSDWVDGIKKQRAEYK